MNKLNPHYVTGLVDGEGSFYVGILPRLLERVKWETRPSFSLSQNKENKRLVFLLKDFFDCGSIRPSKKDNTLKYEVRSLKDLSEKILPHFKKYPLTGQKSKDFNNFQEIILIMQKQEHLETKGLRKIVKLAITMTKNPRRLKFLKRILTLLKV